MPADFALQISIPYTRTMNIVCVYAYPAEVEHFQRLIKKAKLTHRFTWICWRREEGAELPEFKKKPDLIVNLGFAGGLSGRPAAGEVALISELTALEKSGPVILENNSEYQKAALNFTQRRNIATVRLLTSRVSVVSFKKKKELAALSGADVVDMEAFWIYQAAKNLSTPFISFKVVSDNADKTAPFLVKRNKKRLNKVLGEAVFNFIAGI